MKNTKRVNIFSIVLFFIWTTVITASLIYNISNIDKKQHSLVLEHAKNAFEKDMMFRNWVAMHGGVYVFPTEKTPPNPYLAHIPNRDLTTTTGEKLTLMNPAYTLRELMENFEGMYGEKGHITSLKLLNPNNKADEWETKVLKKFDKNEFKEYHEFYNYKGKEHLRYMKALQVEPNCLKCHSHQGYKVGDTRGGISITIPMEKYNQDELVEIEKTIYLHLFIYLLSLTIGYFTYRHIMKILKKEEQIEKKLKQKDKILQEQAKLVSMGEMIGNIAHQWRQPLSVISTGATGIKMQCEYGNLNKDSLIETCEMINDNAQYLSRTIEDFKEFVKGNQKKEEFNLTKNIDSFLTLVKGSIKNHYIDLELNLDNSIVLKASPNELIQCFINIFNNSKDELKNHTQERLFYIETFKNKDHVTIKLRDNAGGIPKNIINRIFEPYFTTKHQSQGTGLGLHMTYALIVEGMKGTIEAHNVKFKYKEQEYKGAEFVITLPVRNEKERNKEEE